jgi:hypothetical protein
MTHTLDVQPISFLSWGCKRLQNLHFCGEHSDWKSDLFLTLHAFPGSIAAAEKLPYVVVGLASPSHLSIRLLRLHTV